MSKLTKLKKENKIAALNIEMYLAGMISDAEELARRGKREEASQVMCELKTLLLDMAEERHLKTKVV